MMTINKPTDALWRHISQHICEVTHSPCTIHSSSSVSGGDISQAYVISTEDSRYFVKLNTIDNMDMFVAEEKGLDILGKMSSTLSIAPKSIACGCFENHAYIVLEYLELESKGNEFELGELLAKIHQQTHDSGSHGWPESNFIGTSPQKNDWKNQWVDFWLDNRLSPQLDLAEKNGHGYVTERLRKNLIRATQSLLSNHTPQNSLLHGDLWRGNAGFSAGNPIVYDPACYYGDRETDLALTELFGGFSSDFYAGYRSVLPIDSGYQQRKVIYNLYHLLNHLNLFGTGYLGQVKFDAEKVIEMGAG